jgi:hypothetical protein
MTTSLTKCRGEADTNGFLQTQWRKLLLTLRRESYLADSLFQAGSELVSGKVAPTKLKMTDQFIIIQFNKQAQLATNLISNSPMK